MPAFHAGGQGSIPWSGAFFKNILFWLKNLTYLKTFLVKNILKKINFNENITILFLFILINSNKIFSPLYKKILQ